MPTVSVRGLTKQYTQGDHVVHALRGVDLDIEPGEFTVLMGPSGSGKTTLLNLVGALDLPTAGTVTIDGQALAELKSGKRSDLRLDKLGFVFQSYNLVPVLTAYENVDFPLMMRGVPAAERKQRVMETLAAVGLDGLERRRPSELSGGQQQRVAVARAIAGRPALVLADEPTANLDTATSAELIELMKTLNEEFGVTFLFATHDPAVMAAARRVVKLVDGRIAEDEKR